MPQTPGLPGAIFREEPKKRPLPETPEVVYERAEGAFWTPAQGPLKVGYLR